MFDFAETHAEFNRKSDFRADQAFSFPELHWVRGTGLGRMPTSAFILSLFREISY